ncbi:hypothetical protein [Cellulomonas sp. Y8]|uniref:hypothetical protein n=1 Tax=Cellulomonas sp. Y8 TaxID=2591145 RepID=UPI001FEEF169|nr:hypothetical protein [Cellulomonas sp. Y8]
MTLLRWDPTTREILDWQLVEIGTDASAVVHDPERWPAVVPVPADEEDDADPGSGPSATPSGGATAPPAG